MGKIKIKSMIKNLFLVLVVIVLCNFTNNLRLSKFNKEVNSVVIPEKRSIKSLESLHKKLQNQLVSIEELLNLREDTKEGDLRKYRQAVAGEFLKADRDYDGLLSKQEFFAYVHNAFRALEIAPLSDEKLSQRYNVIDVNN